MKNSQVRSGSLSRSFAVLAAAAVFAVAGCDVDEVLNVEDRDTVNPESLENPGALDIVVTGAIGDFTSAFDAGDAVVSVGAVMSDEFFSSGTFPTRTATDRRDQFITESGNTSDDPYVDLHFARRSLSAAAERVAAAEDRGTDDEDYLLLKGLEGYTVLLLGEMWCSAVPLSTVDESGGFEYGPPNSSAQLFSEAIARFDASLAAGFNEFAAVGKARAHLALGNYAEAAAAVADVETSFTHFVFHSPNAVDNAIYALQGNGRYSQSDNEGGNGLPFRSADDPRTPWEQDPDGGFDENIPLYLSLKYNDFDDPIVLASGVEARLIEAEAELAAGDYVGMTAILNALRADVATIMASWVEGYDEIVPDASLPPLATPTSEAAAIDQLFYERGFWLYLTGHRLTDLRRLVYQYGRDQASVYPNGNYHKGGSYGNDVVLPIDFDEANNDQFDHGLCNVDDASID